MPTIYKQNKTLGFTLIELLVVISVIGLLGTLAVTTLNNARSKARNAVRSATVVQLAKAFKLAADQFDGVLPVTVGQPCVAAECYGSWTSFAADPTVDAAIAPYIIKPVDPRDSRRPFGGYLYETIPGGAQIYWMVEKLPNFVASEVCKPGILALPTGAFQTGIVCMLVFN